MNILKKNQIDSIIQEEFDQYQSLLDNANKYPLLASYILSESDHISRKNMPQVDTKNLSKAIDMIGDNVKVKAGTIQADKLKRSQKELHKDKIIGISKKFKNAKDLKPLVVSSDNYIVDGHHRWAAAAHKWGGDVVIPIIKIGLPKIKAITLFNRIADNLGQMKKESVNEDIDIDSVYAGITTIVGLLVGASGPLLGYYWSDIKKGSLNPKNIISNIKQRISKRKSDKELKSIAQKLSKDPEVIKFIKNPNKSGIKKVLSSKLSDDEMKYLYKLTRSTISMNMKDESIEESEEIPGGLSKGMSLSDIAEKHGLSYEELKPQAIKGMKVELEHTPDKAVAYEIAKDHILEDPKYYDKLDSIEESKKKSTNEVIEIPIEIGDTVLGGKFKNKKIVVKSIDRNEKGDITINGKPLLRFRLMSEGIDINEAQSKLKLNIPKNVVDIHKAFKKEGKKLYIVGGAVRDAILGQRPKDFDLATDAKPDEVLDIAKRHGFKTAEVGKQFGVVIINGEEIATFRKDIGKGRRPEAVDYTDIYGDVKRRDLTINALFYDIDRQQIVDLVGGIADLKNKFVRTVGKAEERFDEDPLRKLRALRFTARIGGRMEKSTLQALQSNPSLVGVSGERIRDEFIKSIKSAKSVKSYLKMADKLKMLQQILPNISYSKDFIDESNPKLQIAYLLRKNQPVNVSKSLKKLKYTAEEAYDIAFLVTLSNFKDSDVYKLKKVQSNSKLSDSEIVEWGKLVGVDLKKFVKFNLSVSGNDVMKMGFKGREVGDKIEKMEIEKFLNESSDDKLQMLKLMNKAMKAFPNSPNQKKIIAQLNVLRKRNGLEPLKEESIVEMSKSDVQQIDKFADKQLNPIDINLTGRHFFDRLNDPRNNKEISTAELIRFFKQLSRKKKEFVDFLNKYNQIVVSDDKTNINIPFMKKANSAIAKTVMRKKDFKTPDKKITIS